MGEFYDALCNDCGTKFEVCEGSGMNAMPLHCTQCGKEWTWNFGDDPVPWVMDYGPRPGDFIITNAEGPDPPPCECGGTFRVDASPRCPNCRSTNFRRDPLGRMGLYD